MVGALVIDGLSKSWAAHALVLGRPWPAESVPRLRLAYNTRLDFGLALPGGGYILYSVLGSATLATLLVIAARVPRKATAYVGAFALVVGGAGNVLERVVRGSVTDFIDFGHGSFNVADIAVTAGTLLYLYVRMRDGRREEGWRGLMLLTAHPLPSVLPPSLRPQSSEQTTGGAAAR